MPRADKARGPPLAEPAHSRVQEPQLVSPVRDAEAHGGPSARAPQGAEPRQGAACLRSKDEAGWPQREKTSPRQ